MRSLALASLLAAVPALAVEIEPGVPYTGPKTLTSSSVGVSIQLPAGWKAQLPPGADAMIIGHDSIAGAIFVTVENSSKAEVRQTLSSPIPVDDMGTVASPKGAVKEKGDRLSVDYAVGPGMNGHAVARVHKDGRAVAVMGLGPDASFATVKKIARGIATSAKFKKVKKPKAGKSSGYWATALKGMKIHRYYSGSGYSEHRSMTLCSDGSFYSSFDGGGFTPGVASGAMVGKGAGTWAVSGSKAGGRLIIQLHGGGTREHQISEQGGKLYVDGENWLREGGGC
jgi:hypothetical protein